jgi:hypothetical protein
MRRGGPPAHPASTQQILQLRDQGLTWNEVAERVDMTVSGAWSRYRRARPPKPPAWAAGSRFSPRHWTRTLRLVSEQRSLIICAEHRTELSSPLPGEPPRVSPHQVALACFTSPVRMATTMQATVAI